METVWELAGSTILTPTQESENTGKCCLCEVSKLFKKNIK